MTTDNFSPREADVVQPENALPELRREDLPPHWLDAMARAGWDQLMPVQRQAIPYLMAGRDLMVQSRTGSGKTGAFVLPILERINPLENACQALVLAPTRELARQVSEEARLLIGPEGQSRVVAVYGGVGYRDQLAAFKEGAHLVVGTPGRVLDHLIKGSLTLQALNTLVFDEADRMLSMGFYPDMVDIRGHLPDSGVDTFMFSATFPPRVLRLARDFMRDPAFLSLSRDNVHVVDMTHAFYSVANTMEKDRALVRIIEVENPDSAIIFCNTRHRVDYVKVVLQRFGYDADALSSDLSQKERERVMARLRAGKLRFLVATDVAARGIDIPELSHVIQYEPPEDHEIYVHRAGRTGRAGASGEALTLVDFMEQVRLKRIARQYGIDLEERPLPDDEAVAEIVAERVTVLLEARLRGRDRLQVERMARFRPLVAELAESNAGRDLLAMLLDDYYQEQLHAIPAPPEEKKAEKRPQGEKKRRRRSSSGRRRRS